MTEIEQRLLSELEQLQELRQKEHEAFMRLAENLGQLLQHTNSLLIGGEISEIKSELREIREALQKPQGDDRLERLLSELSTFSKRLQELLDELQGRESGY